MTTPPRGRSRPLGKIFVRDVTLAHGGGGKAMKDLIDDVFVREFDNPILSPLEDQARLDLSEIAARGSPGLHHGLVRGRPAVLPRRRHRQAGRVRHRERPGSRRRRPAVPLVRGDPRGGRLPGDPAQGRAVDGRDGTGRGRPDRHRRHQGRQQGRLRQALPHDHRPRRDPARHPALGRGRTAGRRGHRQRPPRRSRRRHPRGARRSRARRADRERLRVAPRSRRRPARRGPSHPVPARRDARGRRHRAQRDRRRLAVGIEIDDTRTPLRPEVRGFCEILGLDPLYLANEGKLVAVVPAAESAAALAALRAHPLGREAIVIGEIHAEEAGRVVMRTLMGGVRIVDMLVGEQLPRIC